MRTHFLRAAIGFGFLVIAAVLVGDLFPDQVHASLEWGRDWARIVTTRNSCGLPANKDPNLRFDAGTLSPPFLLRKSSAPRPYVDAEGYKVFGAWLTAVLGPHNPVVQPESAFKIKPIDRCFPKEMRQAFAYALTDFAANNAENWRFDRRAIANSRGVGTTTKQREPEVSFSAVGFNEDRTVAVVYAIYWCGPLCGRATYYILDKRNGRWANVRGLSRCGWIS
jgi:hypothetical protein